MSDSNFLLDLYACPPDPGRWQQTLDRLCSMVNVRSAVIQRLRRSANGFSQTWVARDSFSTSNAAMHDRLVNNTANPRYHNNLLDPAMFNRIIREEDQFPRLSSAEVDAFRQRLTLAQLGQSIGAMRPTDSDEVIAVIVHRDSADSRSFSADEEGLLLELLPHIGQASELSWQFSQAARRAAQLRSIADRLRVGIIQLSDDRRIEWMNQAAFELLSDTAHLVRSGDTLSARNAQDRRKLAALIAEEGEGTGSLAIFGEGDQNELQAMRLHDAGPLNAPALLISAPRLIRAAPLDAIAQMLQVTLAEARVSEAMLAGSTLKTYARSRGISEGSARNQLKQVFAKTGLKRQSELVGYLSNSVTSYAAFRHLKGHRLS